MSRPVFTAFTTEWAAAWAAQLNASPAYREAAAEWEGGVVLELAGEAGHLVAAVFLDLWRGACRAGRAATEADREAARYVFQGSAATWRHLLEEGASPVMAILSGRLRLVRGDLVSLLPYAAAARELLRAPSGFATAFPAP